MSKAVAGLALSALLGVGSLALWGGALGAYAEAASLALVGLGLVASSQALSFKRGASVDAQDVEGSRAA